MKLTSATYRRLILLGSAAYAKALIYAYSLPIASTECDGNHLVFSEHEMHMAGDTHIKAYEEAGKYIVRELNLINNRLTWILTIHGFLYATYGFTLQKQLEINEKIYEQLLKFHRIPANAPGKLSLVCSSIVQTDVFALAIIIVGMSISCFGLSSIKAACKAMHSVSMVFSLSNGIYFKQRVMGDYQFYQTQDGMSFPHLLGGGILGIDQKGNNASKAIPFVLLISWIIAMLGLAYTLLRPEGRICF